MASKELTNTVAKAIYEKRNGRGCKPWSFQTMSHKQPYLDDAEAAISIILDHRRAGMGTKAAIETDGWKTMGSAPRDGTQVLGYDAKTKTCHVTFAMSKDDRWHDPDSHYYSECPPFEPTHWRHLPAAPEVE